MDTFILSLFSKEDKLKPSTFYQVLSGKRTSSVLTYAFFHNLLHVSGIFPQLTEADFNKVIQQLKKDQLLLESEGLLSLNQEFTCEAKHYLTDVDFFKYGRKEAEIWRSIQFLVQVASYLDRHQPYVPLESSPFYTERVRQFVHQYRKEMKETIYQELVTIFSQLPAEKANLLAQTFTGFEQNGVVFFQLLPADIQQFPWSVVAMSSATHAFFKEISQQPTFLLYQFIKPLLAQNINISMLKTRKLFKQGYNFEEVMQIRHLKQGTIQDHVIEWALVAEDFPFDQFITNQTSLATLPDDSWNFRYKELVEQYDVSFLEIRLYQIWRKKTVWS